MVANSSGVSRLSNDRMSLVTKIARMYHEEGIRQPEIAERLHISQSRVSRFLKEAVNLGIVRTIVVPPPGVHSELEESVRDRFGLIDVVVASSDSNDEASVLTAIGRAGAAYLETTLTGEDRVGLSSWSSTLLATVESMSPGTKRTAQSVVQILGGVGNPSAQVKATHLADRLARVTGASASYFPAPGVVASPSVRDALLADPHMAEVVASWATLTVALVGIGSVEPSPLLQSSGNALSEGDLARLRSRGAVGDVCLQFFDSAGVAVDDDLRDRVVGISAQQLRAIPRRVGIAGGTRKHEAIRAAAAGGWVNVLITDASTAEAMLATGGES